MLELDHPFICNMDYLFETQQHFYFFRPFISGDDLYKVFKKHRKFDESVVKFYAA